jgi:hypothetical protein
MDQANSGRAGRNISGLLFRNKYLIVTSVVLFVLAASAYLFFSAAKYKVMMELSVSGKGQSSETAINDLKSGDAIQQVIHLLSFDVSYYQKGTFTKIEIYGDSLPVKFMPGKGSVFSAPTELTVNLINNSVCRVDQNNVVTDVPLYQPVKYESLSYMIVRGPAFKPLHSPLTIKLSPPADLTEYFNKNLNTKILSDDTFELSLKVDNVQKGYDFLNKLISSVNTQYTKISLPGKPATANNSLLIELNDSITYYKAMADNYREQQNVLNNIKKPRPALKPKPKPEPVPEPIAWTEKERSDLNALAAIKSYTSKPDNVSVLIPGGDQVNDSRIESMIKEFNNAQIEKQRVMQDSDNSEASTYAFKLELNSIKDALVKSINIKEQKIRNAHPVRYTRQLKEAKQPQNDDQPKSVDQPKDSKSIASFLSLQLNDSLAQIAAKIKSKQLQYDELLHGTGVPGSSSKLTIIEKSDMKESMLSKSLLVYVVALLAGLLLPVLFLAINSYITSAKRAAV